MHHSSLRRSLLLATITVPLASICNPLFAVIQPSVSTQIQAQFAQLETFWGGRLGLSAFNTGNNKSVQYRAEERFPVCSTFKAIAVAAVLKRSMTDNNLMQQRINYKKTDLVTYSPITEKEKRVTGGMTVAELCAATMEYSDNTAANLLMKILGGPAAVTDFTRSIGDNTFRLDRWETELNSAVPGDLLDTSTPAAMARTLQKITLGDVLAPRQREQLQVWLKNNTTGDNLIRAEVPKGWLVGDKTGAGSYGTRNDIAVLWPPTGAPIIIAIYFTQPEKDAPMRNEVIAAAARLAINALK